MPLPVVIYTRLSRDETGTQTATRRQESACRAFAELRDWKVAEVFEDVDISAYRRGVVRPGYEDMFKVLERRAAAGVVVWKLDRLVRRPAEFERFWSLCESHDVFLASATEPIDSSTELGLALVRILVTFASLESATIAVRTRARQRELAVAGHPPAGKVYGLSQTGGLSFRRRPPKSGRALGGCSPAKRSTPSFATGTTGESPDRGGGHGTSRRCGPCCDRRGWSATVPIKVRSWLRTAGRRCSTA